MAFAFGVVGESGSWTCGGDTDVAEGRGRGGGGIICLSTSGDLLLEGASPSVTDIDGPGGSVGSAFVFSRRGVDASPFCCFFSSRCLLASSWSARLNWNSGRRSSHDGGRIMT